jgi:hypothetical protein
VLINFISHLWLTDRQISKLSTKFMPTIPIGPSDPGFWVASSFIDHLQELRRENEVTIADPIAFLSNIATVKTLAVDLAQALTVLEDTLRRTDSVGECIRWSTRNHKRDFLSFPERVSSIRMSSPRYTKTKDASKVEIWVLQSILQEEQPEHVGLRYLLFYKVAKVLLFICNSFHATQRSINSGRRSFTTCLLFVQLHLHCNVSSRLVLKLRSEQQSCVP